MDYRNLVVFAAALVSISVLAGLVSGTSSSFQGTELQGTSCVASPGFLCMAPTLYGNGTISVEFGQNFGSTMYDIALACVSYDTSPANYQNYSFQALDLLANMSSSTLASGDVAQVSGLQCYWSNGQPVSLNIGQSFQGYLYLRYSDYEGGPYTFVKVATFYLKAITPGKNNMPAPTLPQWFVRYIGEEEFGAGIVIAVLLVWLFGRNRK
jgi:hypothetical protein